MPAKAKAVATSESGFSVDDAEVLGVRFVVTEADRVLAEFRRDGAAVSWGPSPMVRVLGQIEDWHKTRLSMGAADPKPMGIEVRS